jgi:hypothetical protein
MTNLNNQTLKQFVLESLNEDEINEFWGKKRKKQKYDSDLDKQNFDLFVAGELDKKQAKTMLDQMKQVNPDLHKKMLQKLKGDPKLRAAYS